MALSFALACSLTCAAAQAQVPPACQTFLSHAPTALADVANSTPCFWELALPNDTVGSYLLAASNAGKKSSATQTGASTSANGTTSAISKPLTPLTSLASEYGGITSSTSNQTVTLQTTFDGIPQALIAHGRTPFCWSKDVQVPGCIKQATIQALNRFGVGVTANTSTSSASQTGTAGSGSGTTQSATVNSAGNSFPSFSSAFFKLALIRGSYSLPKQQTSATGKNGSPVTPSLADFAALVALLQSSPNQANYAEWQTCMTRQISRLGTDPSIITRYYVQVTAILFANVKVNCDDAAPASSPRAFPPSPNAWQSQFRTAIDRAIASTSIFEAQELSAFNQANKAAASFEYDVNTPASQPSNSVFKLIGSNLFGDRSWLNNQCKSAKTDKLKWLSPAVNLGASMYNSQPSSSIPTARRLRDIQAGAELDSQFCTSDIPLLGKLIGDSTASLAFYYQDQTSASILKVTPGSPVDGITFTGLASSTSQVYTQKGHIDFAQFRYGFGTGKNVNFPIAFSWSNRTELIAHAIWGLQFGVSYNFSSLLTSNSSTSSATSAAAQ